jgi:hypothetical protein
MGYRPPPYEGGCACGQVRFCITEAPVGARICHCRLCQKAMAAPFLVQASFPARSVSLTGETAYFQSSPRLRRHYCTACGTRVLIEPILSPERLAIHVAALDDPSSIRPEMHIWVGSKVDWLTIGDDLPQHPGASPEPFRPI